MKELEKLRAANNALEKQLKQGNTTNAPGKEIENLKKENQLLKKELSNFKDKNENQVIFCVFTKLSAKYWFVL